MRTGLAIILSIVSFVLTSAVRAHYVLADSYVGREFFDSWTWETMNDPTNGRVNYVSKGTAMGLNLSFASDEKFIMRADYRNVVPSSTRGRRSVRITSNKAYGDSVTVLDLEHMPEGCATWPAFWSLSQKGPWPAGGEIDIVEGVNLQTQNLMSLHTLPQCIMPQQRAHLGTVSSTNCDASVNFNQGCGVNGPPGSYGAPLNAGRGGWFVMARSKAEGVRVWFWARGDPNVPTEVSTHPIEGILGIGATGTPTLFPDPTWGPPTALFPMDSSCDYEKHFDDHQFVFDLTFCGDWAGNAYPNSGCPGSCTDYVDNHPEAFENAFWEVNAVRVYTPVARSNKLL
ncbi:glycoside hydrolase family 16 protein [Laetiporus sulphureus 93-53]|uniref:Glycoside hydrolase family 16 protein n=1 Tax=Laetiporus sulphureus 93-53 TaxID=1314785 RepID=A0A165GS53_9APHY|nr:glycoside hydrolase family 16 protein [Laetiporus sulphureus 93-53]KZT10733.1 glycoside hydrolase family 16 protein [Laetiporus sulphureus 93-53]